MKKEALAAAISRRSRFLLTDVNDLLTLAFDEIGNALGKGEQVRLGHCHSGEADGDVQAFQETQGDFKP